MKTKQSNKNDQGMVLIVALIMLAMVTFMVVAFLAYARVDRSSVAMSMRAMEVDLMGDRIQARVQAIMNRAMNGGAVPFANGAGVSENVDGAWATSPGDHNATSLLGLKDNARPPVYVDTNGTGVYDEFRYFLNLNHDRNANGAAIYQPTTPEEIGDPHWIGVLEDSSRTHGPDNRFVARYAYLVVPTDQQLDINRVHNKNKSIFVLLEYYDKVYKVYSEGYQRLQGNACWEMNLAGALAMIDSQMFNYEEYIQLGHKSSVGRAFEYAGGPHFELPVYAGLWNYRYPNNTVFLHLDNFARDRTNQREFIDLLDFLKKPGLGDVREEIYPNTPTDYEYLHDYFKNSARAGRAFYDMLGSITTHAAVAPTTHLSPQTMKPILGMPPTEKLLINKFFTDADFSHPDPASTTSLNVSILTGNYKFEVDEAVGTVAEVIVFNEDHKLTTGQRVSFWVEYAAEVSTLYYYGTTPTLFPNIVRELYVEVLDSRRVTLWDVPIRPGDPILHPDDSQKVRFAASQPNGDGVVPVSDLSDYPEPLTFFFSYEPLAKKFTELASLMLQNAMVRTSVGLNESFHIGSDPDLVLFDNFPAGEDREKAARYFGANNIQIYPPDENNFTPEVQRLLQVALNLTEVYSPNTGYDINGDGNSDLRLAWPLVFRPIISHEAGDKVYIAGWRRLGREEPAYWTNTPWWTYGYDLPVAPPLPSPISPMGWLGKVPDAQRTGIALDPNPKAPPVYGNGSPVVGISPKTAPFPLLIGVNKGTQANVNGAVKIWPSVNELSASVEWGVNWATGVRTPKLRVGVELRDNLRTTSLQLRLLVRGTISGTLNGAPFTKEIFLNQGLPKYLPTTLEVERPPFLVYYPLPLPAPPTPAIELAPGTGSANPSQRASWKVDNLVLKADVVIVCTDPNYPARERVIDMARVDFSADLPPQWEEWKPSFKYKIGDQVGFGGERYYARPHALENDFLSSPDIPDETKWRRAYWEPNVDFKKDEVIRCLVDSDWRLYRCVKGHTSPGSFTAMVDGQWPWKPYWGEVYEMSWQVNDPLVNGMGRDYTLVHPLVKNNAHPEVKYNDGTKDPPPPNILYIDDRTSNNLGFENYVYRPWNVVNTSEYNSPTYARPWGDSYDFTSLKDPGVFSSAYWTFPHKNNLPAGSSAALETIGWLGLVHRGTPWQTVYLKSKPADRLLISSIDPVSGAITPASTPFFWNGDFVKLEGGPPEYQNVFGNIDLPDGMTLWDTDHVVNKLFDGVGYTHNHDNPASWMYLINTYPWQRQTGTLDTLPTNDHRLVDIFSTSLSEAARTSLLSVNAKSPAAWAAVLSGVAVPKSKVEAPGGLYFHRKHPGNCTETDCVRFGYRLAPNQYMRDLVKSINEHRVLHGGDQDNKNFERVSDILSVPELTISQPAYQAMIARREVDRAEAPERPDWWAPYYPDELDYERIPQQILSLLRTDSTPRFVAYVFSQTLKPAKGAPLRLDGEGEPILMEGSLDGNGLCHNYAITSESAQRTVFRIEGMEKLREYHYRKKLGLPNPNPDGGNEPPSTRVVKESTVPLKLR